MSCDPYPLRLAPVYKDYIWGGRRILDTFGRSVAMNPVAESWEVADRPEGMSVVTNGPWAGTTLHDLVAAHPELILGAGTSDHRFPLLVKIIDAKQRLSVQVHPNDDTAQTFGGEAKTEMWYVLDAEPNAKVFAGLRKGTDRALFQEQLANTQLEDVLTSIPVRPGDAIYIPGGRVHAIAEGCLLLEVQQNSNTTYRVYDWGRLGKDGQPRDLHIDKALEVINWKDESDPRVAPVLLRETVTAAYWNILQTPYFSLTRIGLRGPEPLTLDPQKPTVLFALSGEVTVETAGDETKVPVGSSCLLPAAISATTLTPGPTPSSVMCITP